MEIKDFNKVIKEQIDRSLKLLICKGEEYAKEDFDRLKCFKTAGALEGVGTIQALAGMMGKHTVSIYDMCKNPNAYTLDKWNEKITDHINYLLILRAVIEEEKQTYIQAKAEALKNDYIDELSDLMAIETIAEEIKE